MIGKSSPTTRCTFLHGLCNEYGQTSWSWVFAFWGFYLMIIVLAIMLYYIDKQIADFFKEYEITKERVGECMET